MDQRGSKTVVSQEMQDLHIEADLEILRRINREQIRYPELMTPRKSSTTAEALDGCRMRHFGTVPGQVTWTVLWSQAWSSAAGLEGMNAGSRREACWVVWAWGRLEDGTLDMEMGEMRGI